MTPWLAVLWLVLIVVIAILLRRRGATPGVIGLGAAILLALPAAALYATRDLATHRVADFIALTIPATLAAWCVSRVLLAPGDSPLPRGVGGMLLATGGVLLFIAAAGRIDFLDAQLILAAGIVLIWLLDHGRAANSPRPSTPLAVITLSVVAGILGALILWRQTADTATVTLAAPAACLALMAVAVPSRRHQLGADAATVFGASTPLLALAFGALAVLVRTTLDNFAIINPVGYRQALEVVAISAASTPRLTGLARLAPEAALLAAAGAAILLIDRQTRLRSSAAMMLLAAAAAVLALRVWRLPSITVF